MNQSDDDRDLVERLLAAALQRDEDAFSEGELEVSSEELLADRLGHASAAETSRVRDALRRQPSLATLLSQSVDGGDAGARVGALPVVAAVALVLVGFALLIAPSARPLDDAVRASLRRHDFVAAERALARGRLGDARWSRDASPTRSGVLDEAIPPEARILEPRVMSLSTRPTLRWWTPLELRGVPLHLRVLSEDAGVLLDVPVSGDSFQWPTSAKSLERDRSYWMQLDGPTPRSVHERIVFTVAANDVATSTQAALARIDRDASGPGRRFARAQALARAGCVGDAAREATELATELGLECVPSLWRFLRQRGAEDIAFEVGILLSEGSAATR